MPRRSMSIVMGIGVALGGVGLVGARAEWAHAEPTAPQTPAHVFDALERALPAGWSLLVAGAELVIRHDQPCYVTGIQHANARVDEPPPAKAPGGGPLITLELRYRLEPRWSAKQFAAAKATNEQVASELRGLAGRYQVDTIRKSKGRPLPATPDERARLEAYEAAQAPVVAKLVSLPRCSLGDTSVFDGPDTYAQLGLIVDPPEVMTQAFRIVELMKQHCG